MTAFANWAWPMLAIGVLGASAVMTLASGLAPIRGLATALRTWSGSRRATGADGGPALALPLAAAAGMGGITGGTLAVSAAGPGALPWMWIATLLGMGLAFAEGSLGSRRPKSGDKGGLHLPTSGAIGRTLTPLYAVALLALAVLGGAMLQTNQASAVLGEAMWVPAGSAGVGLALATIVFVFSTAARDMLLRLVPVAIVLFALVAATVVFADGMDLQLRMGDAFNDAFGLGAAAGGTAGGVVAVAIHHGVLRATLAGEAGLGTAGLAGLRTDKPGTAGALTMLVAPLTAGVLATLSALLLMTGSGPESIARPDATASVASDTTDDTTDATTSNVPRPMLIAEPDMVPLERPISKGLRPSQQVGQTIVIPADTTMEPGNHYGVMLRSHPRGHATAKLDVARNAVIMPAWQVAEDVDAVIFRSELDGLKDQTGWDVRIPCDREVRKPEGGKTEFLKLTPKDPNLKLKTLVKRLRLNPQAYVPMGDFAFKGYFGGATTGDLGSHLAMFEPEYDERPFNPKLHEFYRNAYRGPFADDGSPRAPWAFVSAANFQPEIGSFVRLRLQADPRGEPFISVTRAGHLEAPAWDFLMSTREVVLRHDTDPGKDYRVPVEARYEEFRIRFKVTAGNVKEFARIPEGWSGPFAVVPDYEFLAEVRGDTRLPPAFAGRRALVPVHDKDSPSGPTGVDAPYAPHPGTIVEIGMHGPVLAIEGSARVVARLRAQLGAFGTMSMVMCTVVLALSSIVAWSLLTQRVAGALGGPMLAKAMPVIMIAAAATGSWISLPLLIAWTDVAAVFVVVTNIVGLLVGLPAIIAAGRDLGGSGK